MEIQWLIRNGVPEAEALVMEPAERLARCIVFGQFEGMDWDWDNMRWKKPNA